MLEPTPGGAPAALQLNHAQRLALQQAKARPIIGQVENGRQFVWRGTTKDFTSDTIADLQRMGLVRIVATHPRRQRATITPIGRALLGMTPAQRSRPKKPVSARPLWDQTDALQKQGLTLREAAARLHISMNLARRAVWAWLQRKEEPIA